LHQAGIEIRDGDEVIDLDEESQQQAETPPAPAPPPQPDAPAIKSIKPIQPISSGAPINPPPQVELPAPAPVAPPEPELDPQTKANIDFVVREFGSKHDRDGVIRAYVERVGCSWSEADEFIRYVEREHSHRIARSQAPLLLFFGIGGLIGGLGLVFIHGYAIVYKLQTGELSRLGRNIGWFVFGLMLLVASVIGLAKQIKDMQQKKKMDG
jgi:hypothetical protein